MTRRALLGALCGAGALVAISAGAVANEPLRLEFDVFRNGNLIGNHLVNVRREAGRTEVDVAIDFKVTFAFVPVFRYTHRNREVWNDGRLVSLETRTDDDGDNFYVSAKSDGERIRLRATTGDTVLPPDVLTTSYWDRRMVKRSQLINTQTGELAQLKVVELGREPVQVGGRSVEATRYRITGDLDAELWYAIDDTWAKLRFKAKDGSEIEYRRK